MHKVVEQIIDAGSVAVIRIKEPDRVAPAIEALLEGGVRGIEITMTVPGAIEQIAKAAARFGDSILLGVGSVVEVAQADAAIGAGARFVVGPATVPEVVTHCVGKGVPVMPGVYTPSEILAASRLGAEVVKVFPADGLGPKYIKNVLAPLPWLKLMPTGGVTPENAGEWIAAGASVLGLGSALVNPGVVAKGDWAEITRRAKTLMDNIKTARGGSAG